MAQQIQSERPQTNKKKRKKHKKKKKKEEEKTEINKAEVPQIAYKINP